MIFGYFTLLVALIIEAVGAYYSVTGLAAIFSGAVIPILIMGGALEVGKVTAAVWLKMYWERASLAYKLYLVPAVALLMVITSMGIFGFLSKAHSDQNLVSGDVIAKIAIYDEKIKTEKENIEANRKALKQMDEGVDQVLGRSTDEKGADKAVAMRRSQQKERSRLQAEILQSQKSIAELSDARAPIAAEVRKVENEVGPIKYIAALIYGDNPDASILERAVSWVIILIVAVFDPLALVLILAAQQSLRWAKEEQEEKNIEAFVEQAAMDVLNDVQAQEEDTPVEVNKDTQAEKTEGEPELSFWEKHPYLLTPFAHFKGLTPMVWRPDPTEHTVVEDTLAPKEGSYPFTEEEIAALSKHVVTLEELAAPIEVATPEIYAGNPDDFKEPWSEEDKEKLVEAMQDIFDQNKQAQEEQAIESEVGTQKPEILAMGVDVVERPGDYITPPEHPTVHYFEGSDHIHHNGKSYSVESFKANFPDLAIVADNHPVLNPPAKASFGNEFPLKPDKGDMFLRTDYLPSRQFKFNGSKWIEVEKNTDVLAYDEQYIQHLVDRISRGEYEVEDLNETEQEQIKEYLKKLTDTKPE